MAHARKDTLVSCGEWAKHLKPFGKRMVAKAERKAAQKEVKKEVADRVESEWFNVSINGVE